MTWDEYVVAWSRLHGGFDPGTASPVVRGWLRAAYRIGSWLGRMRVGPSAVTTAGLICCLAVPVAAPAGRAGLLAGALLVVLAALADALDGAVAVVTGRASRCGFVADSLADRVGEAAWLTAFWLVGAPGWLAAAAGAASWLHEYARARATVAGMSEIGVVTVAERPTRVLVAVGGLAVAGVLGRAPLVVTIAAAVWLGLAVVGSVQLTRAIRRALAAG